MRDGIFRLFILLILLVAGAYTPALAQEMIPLDVRIGASTNHLPFMIALEEGIYQKNGLDVEHFIPSGTARNAKQDGGYGGPPICTPSWRHAFSHPKWECRRSGRPTVHERQRSFGYSQPCILPPHAGLPCHRPAGDH